MQHSNKLMKEKGKLKDKYAAIENQECTQEIKLVENAYYIRPNILS